MDDSQRGQPADGTKISPAHARLTEPPLPRRTFLGRLGLAVSLGLAGVAAACGRGSVAQQEGGQQGRANGTDAPPEENSGTSARQDDSQSNSGQETEAAGTGTSGANGGTVGVGCIGVFVADLRASLDFYRRLGVDIPEDAGGNGYAYRLRLPTGQVFFWESYRAVRAFDPDWQPSSGNRRMVLEFGFATPEALNDKYTELTSANYGGYLDPFTFAGSTVRYALIRDPDGNEVGMRCPEC